MNYCTPDDIATRLYFSGRQVFLGRPRIEVKEKDENFSQLIFDFSPNIARVSKNQETFDVYTGNDENKNKELDDEHILTITQDNEGQITQTCKQWCEKGRGLIGSTVY